MTATVRASALQLAQHCALSPVAAAALGEQQTASTSRGTAVHAQIEGAIELADLEALTSEHRAVVERAIEIAGAMAGGVVSISTEVSGSVNIGCGVVTGTCDALARCVDGVVVIDWKSGAHYDHADVRENLQLAAYSLMHGCSAAVLALVDRGEVQSHVWQPGELDLHCRTIADVLDRIDSGPQARIGTNCAACRASGLCPDATRWAVGIAGALDLPADADPTPDMVVALKAASKVLSSAADAASGRAAEWLSRMGGDCVASDGSRARVVRSTYTHVDGDAAYAVLGDCDAVETKRVVRVGALTNEQVDTLQQAGLIEVREKSPYVTIRAPKRTQEL